MKNQSKDFGLFFWIHLIFIVFAYFSPLWLDWKIILTIVMLLEIYYLVRGGCDLTFWEFGQDKDITFVWYYLRKVFPRLDQKKTKLFLRIILPIILVVVSFISQYYFQFRPLIILP